MADEMLNIKLDKRKRQQMKSEKIEYYRKFFGILMKIIGLGYTKFPFF